LVIGRSVTQITLIFFSAAGALPAHVHVVAQFLPENFIPKIVSFGSSAVVKDLSAQNRHLLMFLIVNRIINKKPSCC